MKSIAKKLVFIQYPEMEYKYKSRICPTGYNKLNFNPIKHHPTNKDEMEYNPMNIMRKHYNKGLLQQFW